MCPEYDELKEGKCVEKKTSDCTDDTKKLLHIDGKCMAACPEFYEDKNGDKKCTLLEKSCANEADSKVFLKGDSSCVAKCDDYLFTDDTKK